MVEWVRTWSYELEWRPEYRGRRVHSREVASVAQLRAVVEWARANPHVIKWAIRPKDTLVGEPATVCRLGHPLVVYPAAWRRSRWLRCAGCPGHHLTTCQECGDRVIEPEPGPGCGPVPADEQHGGSSRDH